MKRGKLQSHAISGVFVFLLLGIFAVFSTVMVVLGARAYRNANDRSAAHNASRISSSYVRSMVRADDERGALRVEELEGMQVLTFENEYDGEAYVTRLYVSDGMLREMFTEADYDFVPEEGEGVCPMDEMTASLEGGRLSVRLRSGEEWTEVVMALRAAAQ